MVAAAYESRDLLRKGLVIVGKRIELLYFRSGEPLVAEHLERADSVSRPLAHSKIDHRFSRIAIDDQRVAEDPEIDEASARVKLRNPLGEVSRVFGVIELSLSKPEESFGLGLHYARDVVGRNPSITGDLKAGYRQAAPLLDTEVELDLVVGFAHRVDVHAREVVALGFV